MKKRRSLVIAALLVAALALGIGYAAFSSDMSILGEIQMGGIASQVVFSDAQVNDEASTAEVVKTTINGLDSKGLTIDMEGFVHAGHYVIVDVTISNPHDFPVVIESFTLTQDGEKNPAGAQLFSIEVVDDALAGEPTIAAESELDFQLKITCLATSPVDATENFEIKFKAASTVEEPTDAPTLE